MAKKNEAKKVVEQSDENFLQIPQISLQAAVIHIVGETDLIFHKWSEKAKKEMRDKQTKSATVGGKAAKDADADMIDTLYFISGEPKERTKEALSDALANGARIGFPATAFKQSAIMGAYRAKVLEKTTEAKAALIIPVELVEIQFESLLSREDMVRIGGISKVADIRYRAAAHNWSADIPIRFNDRILSLEMVTNLFQYGGFACGVGEWRMEKGGTFGAYKVSGVTEHGKVAL